MDSNDSAESAHPKESIRPVADNFSKFALGLAAAALLLGLIILGYFLLVSRKTNTPHTPSSQSELCITPKLLSS